MALASLLARALEAHALVVRLLSSTASIETVPPGADGKFSRTLFTGSEVSGNENSMNDPDPRLRPRVDDEPKLPDENARFSRFVPEVPVNMISPADEGPVEP